VDNTIAAAMITEFMNLGVTVVATGDAISAPMVCFFHSAIEAWSVPEGDFQNNCVISIG